MKLVLLGYMASGKTSIGRRIAKKLQLPFIDLDDYIVEKENSSIPDIFKTKGEIYFRKIETQYLQEILTTKNNYILALGGGTPCYGNNMDLVNKYSVSLFLKSSLNATYNKLSKQKNKKKRPLIATLKNKDIKEFIAKHLFERLPFYEKADYNILTDGKNKETISEEIILLLV